MGDKSIIDISAVELRTLVEWVEKLEVEPAKIRLTASHTGIGLHIRAEVETSEGEGLFKDITDYESW